MASKIIRIGTQSVEVGTCDACPHTYHVGQCQTKSGTLGAPEESFVACACTGEAVPA